MSLMHLEDFSPGQTFDLGSIHVTHEQVVNFAEQFDPQPFHLDIDAGGQSIFGGLIASGWHTCSLMMRLVVDNLFSRTATLGSPGVNQIRWMLPVRPGDTLTASTRVLAVTSSVSKPDRGTVEFHYEVRNQSDQQVLAMQGISMFRRREGQEAAA
jgi:acyl dehydratase